MQHNRSGSGGWSSDCSWARVKVVKEKRTRSGFDFDGVQVTNIFHPPSSPSLQAGGSSVGLTQIVMAYE